MNSASPLLAQFQQLAQNHTTQFEPQLAQIHRQLDMELVQLQQQEAELVQAQERVLKELRQAINTDARFLLATAQFQSFVDSILPLERLGYHSQPQMRVAGKVADWLLNQSTQAIGISNYQEEVDHDGYDDERTYTLYSYSADIQWGDRSGRIREIQIERIYGVSERVIYNPDDRINAITDSLYDFYEWGKSSDEEKMVMLEMGYLIYYGCTLLKLQPQRVQITYDSTSRCK